MAFDSSQMWTECVQWMIRCQVLDPSHRVTSKQAEIVDFAQALRDGVLLCQLANHLCKSCIDVREVSLRPQLSQFLCVKNICLFLDACQKYFGLKSADLFEAGDLYKVSDFGKVLQTLSKLSRTPHALLSGVAAFPENVRTSPGAEPEYYNQAIYKALAEVAETKELEEEIYDHINEDAKIYDFIITKPHRQQEPTFLPKDKREHCIKELLDTEKNYVEALDMIQQEFCTPLREILSQDDYNTIFMNLEHLLQVHKAFQSDLLVASRISLTMGGDRNSLISNDNNNNNGFSNTPPTQQRIGDIFVRWKQYFVCYSTYCSKLPESLRRIIQLAGESASIRQKILECQIEANANKFTLQDVLSVPVQRVLKYHLLLRELVKHTPDSHADYISVQMGLEAMVDLSFYINEVKRDCETLETIRQIQRSIIDIPLPCDTQLCDYGHLLKDGELKVSCHADNDRRAKNRYVFAFDRVLLVCKPLRAGHYTYKNFLLLDDFKIEDNEQGGNRTSQTLLGRAVWTYSWNLVKNNADTVFNFYTKSKENKEKWLQALQTAKDNIAPPAALHSDHLFQYCTLDQAVTCSYCNKLLRGLFFQGYRCTRPISNAGAICQVKVHKECIPFALPCGSVKRQSSARQGRHFTAIRTFNGKPFGPDYLTFKEGDRLEIVCDRTGVSGWWRGKILSGEFRGQIGLFPRDHVVEGAALSRRTSNVSAIVVNQRRTSASGCKQENQMSELEYKNLIDLFQYPWYVGMMGREQATELLTGLAPGSYLVRFSGNTNTYAISISCQGDPDVKHIKVECGIENGQYYLDQGRYFDCVVKLINYFQENSLKESFESLDTTLRYPVRSLIVGFAVALHNFQATAPNMISLDVGQEIVILSKKDSERGWWKGKTGSKIGYFPLAYVHEREDIFQKMASNCATSAMI